jgi:hypothetical protein
MAIILADVAYRLLLHMMHFLGGMGDGPIFILPAAGPGKCIPGALRESEIRFR